MKPSLTRRAVLTGLFASTATAALGVPVLTSPRPEIRPERNTDTTRPVSRPSLSDFVQAASIGGMAGIVAADLNSGSVLETHMPDIPLPPASVTKVITSLYAREMLGAEYTFKTKLVATAPVENGVLYGDLILVGGGDPTLVTDDLAKMASDLAALGLRQVRGKFLVWGGALPQIREIDEGQLDHMGYNPALGGLNLNFNRVYFEWAKTGADYKVSMDARSELYRPSVRVSRMRVVDRDLPVYTYSEGQLRDEWTVAKGALGNNGGRWLPVRYPALYAGEVFQALASQQGITLTPPEETSAPSGGAELVLHESAPLDRVIKDCLRFSTNITAEMMGLAASAVRSDEAMTLRKSGRMMADWVNTKSGTRAAFVDHSGLGDRSRISASDMVKVLLADGVYEVLAPLLKIIGLRDSAGKPIENHPTEVIAKTGTLNFVSSLAGYIETSGHSGPMAFATFVGDLPERQKSKASQDERPAGAASWSRRARQLQHDLLRRWAVR